MLIKHGIRDDRCPTGKNRRKENTARKNTIKPARNRIFRTHYHKTFLFGRLARRPKHKTKHINVRLARRPKREVL